MDEMSELQNVVAIDPLAERYRAAFDKTRKGREQWIEGTLELAAAIADSRKQYPDHHAFSAWLKRNGLQQMSKDMRWALAGIAGADQIAMRSELERTDSISWEMIWRKSPQRALRNPPKGTPTPKSRRSGHTLRQRRQRIPTVMQEPRPERPIVPLKALTREQVDPDFKGTPLQFATKYGHVNLHTKEEIEHNKQQDELQKWLGAAASAAKAAEAFAALPRPTALDDWLEKPGKAAKKSGWQDSFERAAEVLQPASPAREAGARSEPANDYFPDIPDLGEIPF